MKKVLISGGTGLVGQRLVALLKVKGYGIHILSRSKTGEQDGVQYFRWSLDDGYLDENALNVEHIIHLAGAGVADKRWTIARKKEIRDSRVLSTQLLKEKLLTAGKKPESIVCASAVGYYGNRGDEVLSEDAAPGTGYLSDVCREWEDSSAALGKALGSPIAILRIGIVLSKRGGALPKLAAPVRFGIGAYLGDGEQYYPWIHIDDLCRMMIHAMENRLDDIYNASAPGPVTNKSLCKTIAHVLKKPFIPAPAPAFVLRATMGQMAEMVLNSQRTDASRIQAGGFEFQFTHLDAALIDIFKREI